MHRGISPPNSQTPLQFCRDPQKTSGGKRVQCLRGSDEARTCLKEVWGAALAPVSSRNSSQLKSVSSMLEPSSVQKKKKRKKSSLKHSQRRESCVKEFRVSTATSVNISTRKACFKDLRLPIPTSSYYTFSRLRDFSSQHSEARNDSAFTAVGEQTHHTATGTCALPFRIC